MIFDASDVEIWDLRCGSGVRLRKALHRGSSSSRRAIPAYLVAVYIDMLLTPSRTCRGIVAGSFPSVALALLLSTGPSNFSRRALKISCTSGG